MKIYYNNGVLTLNGSAAQNISGSGNTDNLTADNDSSLLFGGCHWLKCKPALQKMIERL